MQDPYLGMRDLRVFNSAADFDDDDVHGWGLKKKKIKKMTKIFSEGVLLPIWESHSRRNKTANCFFVSGCKRSS
jgi:hypothetical protein